MEMIGLTKEEWYARLFERLGRSKFRSGFHLTQKDIDYIHEKGLDTIRQHARDFIAQREAPAFIPNDGKQTPCGDIRYLWHSMRRLHAAGNAYVSGIHLPREWSLVQGSRNIWWMSS